MLCDDIKVTALEKKAFVPHLIALSWTCFDWENYTMSI